MNRKKLNIDPLKCNGCGDCETACARFHNSNSLEKSRIHILPGDVEEGFYLPTTCQHCENPPCLAVCPEDAIFRNEHTDAVTIDKRRCIGCRMCVSACPFGAMDFDTDLGTAFKCDLCNGDPECARVCETGALEYVDDSFLHYQRLKESSGKYYNVLRHMAV